MTVLTLALSSKEREKKFPRLWNVTWLDWPDDLSPNRNLATACPLLGERKQVREVVKTNQQPRNTRKTRTGFFFRVFGVVRGLIWNGQPAATGAMSGSYVAMNRWNIPEQLEHEVLARDKTCVYCGIEFTPLTQTRGARPSWEHIINDARIITRENIARCCMSCNASKGAKDLVVWIQTSYCQRKGINAVTVAEVVRNALLRKRL